MDDTKRIISKSILTNVASAIRTKKGYSNSKKIRANNFATEINGIELGMTLSKSDFSGVLSPGLSRAIGGIKNNKLYVMGGYNSSDVILNTIYEIDLSANRPTLTLLEETLSYNVATLNHSATDYIQIGKDVYFVANSDDVNVKYALCKINLDSFTITVIGSIGELYTQGANDTYVKMCQYGDTLLIYNQHNIHLYRYLLNTNTIEDLGEFANMKRSSCIVVYDNFLYFVGSTLANVSTYKVQLDDLQQVTTLSWAPPSKGYNTFTIGNRVYLFDKSVFTIDGYDGKIYYIEFSPNPSLVMTDIDQRWRCYRGYVYGVLGNNYYEALGIYANSGGYVNSIHLYQFKL